jgi:hypothetical protein
MTYIHMLDTKSKPISLYLLQFQVTQFLGKMQNFYPSLIIRCEEFDFVVDAEFYNGEVQFKFL